MACLEKICQIQVTVQFTGGLLDALTVYPAGHSLNPALRRRPDCDWAQAGQMMPAEPPGADGLATDGSQFWLFTSYGNDVQDDSSMAQKKTLRTALTAGLSIRTTP